MYWLDISTAAQWRGWHVGITRVEFELMDHALGCEDVSFCAFDLRNGIFREVSREQVRAISSRKLLINLSRGGSDEERRMSRIRHPFRSSPLLWYLSQRIRRRHRNLRKIEIINLHRQKFDHDQQQIPIIQSTQLRPVKLGETDVVISTGLDWDFKDIRKIIDLKRRDRFRYVAMVYDLVALNSPQFVVPGSAERLTDYFGELFWLADHIICNSRAVEKDVREHISTLASANPNVSVVPLGVSISLGQFEKLPRELRGNKYIAAIGTLEPRKNIRTLYVAWEVAIRDGLIDPSLHKLVLVGRKGWSVDDLVRDIGLNPNTAGSVLITGSVDESTLMSIYEHASAIVVPSFHEGFGLPLAEAMAFGKASLSSGQGALAEVGAGLVTEIDPYDVMAWARAISRALTDDTWRSQQEVLLAGRRSKSWGQVASDFFNIIFQEFPECRMVSSH